jgi:BirA family biotin operon repressor/biotin-[acetyl-CoA-carboxylase] ligase
MVEKVALCDSRCLSPPLNSGADPALPIFAVADRPALKQPILQPASLRHDAGLMALLAGLSNGEAHSGSALATRLQVTRAAVWKQIERLRALGLEILAQPGRGYRLAAPLELLDVARIAAMLPLTTRTRFGDLRLHWRLDSTSSELLRHVGTDPRDLIACLAEIQSHGRGRRGRAWQMPLTGGIALSLLKRFDGGMASLAGLSLVVGIAATRALHDCGIHGVGLKWPNDLVARGAKLAGILVELGGDALGPCHAVIGIGINSRLNSRASAAIDQAWIDLATLANGAPPSRNLVVARVLTRLVDALDLFAAEGFAAFAADYARYDVLSGRRVSVQRPDGPREGIVRGVDVRGALLVAFAEAECAVDSGEVSIRNPT